MEIETLFVNYETLLTASQIPKNAQLKTVMKLFLFSINIKIYLKKLHVEFSSNLF
jgi:hypothetical protein